MHEIKLDNETVVFKDDGLSCFWHDYFADRQNFEASVIDSAFLDVIPMIISDVDNEALIQPFILSKVELKIKSMPTDKSPGPDNLLGAFTNSAGI